MAGSERSSLLDLSFITRKCFKRVIAANFYLKIFIFLNQLAHASSDEITEQCCRYLGDDIFLYN
jgi:hypothetical protein